MTVKSFGCSFTWGSELPDEISGRGLLSHHSHLTWPALVAKHLRLSHECFAWPGIGNFYIANNVLTYCINSQHSNDLFIINWTYIDRFDYLADVNNKCHNLTSPWKWKTCRPGEDSDFFKKYHSEARDKLESLQLIKLCIDTLKQLKIRFIMTAIDDLLFDESWNTSPSIKFLQDYTRPHLTMFNGRTFLDYADHCGHARTSGGHLNEYAHRDIAQYVIDLLDTQNITDC